MSSILSMLKDQMDKTVDVLTKELASLRTGRASVNLLDTIRVEAYGTSMPLSQVGTVNVPEPRLVTVQVWDRSMVKPVEKAISESDLGLNALSEGQLIRIPIPMLTEERRKELTKVAGRYSEEAKISLRNARREAMEALKKQEKDGDISEDEQHRLSEKVQEMVESYGKKIDELTAQKQKDIMHV